MSDSLHDRLLTEIDRRQKISNGAVEPFLHGDRTGMDGLHPQIVLHVRNWTPIPRHRRADGAAAYR